MKRMKRFVSYLYSIYNNQKKHNAGFARIELRTGRNRIDIHLRDGAHAGKSGTVYLFTRNKENIQGISIGNIIFRSNQADFRYEQPEENIGQTPWQIMQMNGIIILIENQAAFLSQWDEQPVDTTKFEVWTQERAKTNTEQTNTKQRNTDQMHTDQMINQTDRNQTNINQTNRNQLNTDKENMKKEDTNRKDTNKEDINQEDTNRKDANQEDTNQEDTNQEKSNATHLPLNQSADSSVNEAAGQEKGNQDKRNQESEQNKGSSSEQQAAIQTAELQPQPDSQNWEQTWRYMLRMYPVLNQFEEKNNILCVRIEIKDVRLLPEKYWSMINNSFLLHGFFNYRYLIFGRIEQSWFIGVPGIYQNQEHVMASIFGFPDFLPQAQKNERGEQPGYWYRILEF